MDFLWAAKEFKAGKRTEHTGRAQEHLCAMLRAVRFYDDKPGEICGEDLEHYALASKLSPALKRDLSLNLKKYAALFGSRDLSAEDAASCLEISSKLGEAYREMR